MKIIWSILSQVQIQWKWILKLDFHLLFLVQISVFSSLTKSLQILKKSFHDKFV